MMMGYTTANPAESSSASTANRSLRTLVMPPDADGGPAAGVAPLQINQGSEAKAGQSSGQVAGQVAVLLLADIAAGSRLWGWSRIMMTDWPLRQVPGLRFGKALGSGHQGGFGLRPSASHQGLFALFDTEEWADQFIHQSPLCAAYRQRSREFVVAKLRATSSRGSWSGTQMTPSAAVPVDGPVAALTRASIRPTKTWSFWRHSPHSERALAQATGCRLAVGLGEAPLLRQATFSVWDNQAAMDHYARSGAHLDAIRGAAAGRWFSESMFVRFVPLMLQGQWQGRSYG